MSFVTTVLAFLVTLGILIVIHELGHYWVARKCGVKVLRFSIGFGRPLARWVRGADRTEWVVAALPLGGYVRMLDERDTDSGPISAADLPRAFNRQPVSKRIAIVLAGPVANLLLAIGVYWGLNVAGVMEAKAVLGTPVINTPAARAGLQAGDEVVTVDNEPVRSWSDVNWRVLQRAVDRSSVELTVRRLDGTTGEATLDLAGLSNTDLEGNPLPRIGLTLWGGGAAHRSHQRRQCGGTRRPAHRRSDSGDRSHADGVGTQHDRAHPRRGRSAASIAGRARRSDADIDRYAGAGA
jgi:regulator of sigma E protease